MNRHDFEQLFADIEHADDPYNLRNTNGRSAVELEAVEEQLGARLPDDYHWFLQRYWTGIFGQIDLFTPDRGDSASLLHRQPDGAAGRFVAFCDDGFGNAYCFPIIEGQCEDRVVYYPMLSSEFTGATVEGGFLDFIAGRARS